MKQPRPLAVPGARLIALCERRGNGKPRDLRDAAHEAFHALTVNARNWDREKIHRALVRKFDRAHLWIHEMHARAVEQLVCRHFGVECGTLESWVHVSVMEAIKTGAPFADSGDSLNIARYFMGTDVARGWADLVIALDAESDTQPQRGA
ncbi:MAG TPA: hypothetical protein VIK52_14235 [Opitutaceae bacterium]